MPPAGWCGESTGQRWGEACGANRVNGEYQKWNPPVLPFPGKVPTNTWSSSTHPKILYIWTDLSFTYGRGTFQTIASVLGLRASKFVHGIFKNRVFISCGLSAVPELSSTDFQSQTFMGTPLGAHHQGKVAWCWVWNPCSIGRTSVPVVSLPLWVTLADLISVPPTFLHVLCLYIFSYGIANL